MLPAATLAKANVYIERIDWTQIEWIRNQTAVIQQRIGATHRHSLAFMHIPATEYVDVGREYSEGNISCVGQFNDAVMPVDAKSQSALQVLQRSEMYASLNVGHNHGNEWCCPTAGIHLCYGRHSGYGGYNGYGHEIRGARVIELKAHFSGQMEFVTWIRMEDGRIRNYQTL